MNTDASHALDDPTVERELKFMLDADAFDDLLAWARARGQQPEPVTQVNVYFDTPTRALADQGIMLRVRRKDGRYTVTLKIRTSERTAEQTAIEIDEPLEIGEGVVALSAMELPALGPIPPLVALGRECERRDIPLGTLVRQGTLTTHRTVIQGPEGLQIELDHSEFAGGEDFELECETDDLKGTRAILTAWLDELGVLYAPSTLPKVARLFATF